MKSENKADNSVKESHSAKDPKGSGERMAGARKYSDTELLDWLHERGSIEIECDAWDYYSIGDQIGEERKYGSLRAAIQAEMVKRRVE